MTTKKDLVKIVTLISSLQGHDDMFVRNILGELRDGLADMFAQGNPRFDVSRWNAACEPKPFKPVRKGLRVRSSDERIRYVTPSGVPGKARSVVQ